MWPWKLFTLLCLHHQGIDGKFHQIKKVLLFFICVVFLRSVTATAAPMSIYFHLAFACQQIAKKKYGVFDVRARNHNTVIRWGKKVKTNETSWVRLMPFLISFVFIVRGWRMNSCCFRCESKSASRISNWHGPVRQIRFEFCFPSTFTLYHVLFVFYLFIIWMHRHTNVLCASRYWYSSFDVTVLHIAYRVMR